jgi:hypothetical protein
MYFNKSKTSSYNKKKETRYSPRPYPTETASPQPRFPEKPSRYLPRYQENYISWAQGDRILRTPPLILTTLFFRAIPEFPVQGGYFHSRGKKYGRFIFTILNKITK